MTAILRLPLALLVLAYQSVVLALGQIWANKVRGVLTTVGIMIGVAAVTAVIALISGMRDTVLKQFEAFGTNKMWIFPWRPPTQRFQTTDIGFRVSEFTGFLDHCPSVSRFTRIRGMGGPITFQGHTETENVSITGVDATWHAIMNRYVTVGRPLSDMDVDQIRPVCLINPLVRDRMGLDRDPTGQFLTVGGNRLMVIGILEPPPGPLENNGDTLEVVVPFTYAMHGYRTGFWVVAEARSPDASEDARGETLFFLHQRRHLRPGQEENFRCQTAQRELEQFGQVTATVTLIAVGIVGISLLVGGVGIMNIMLVSVSERTREIGLRKAVGARPAAILLQFLIEAVVLCMVGGFMGLAFGQAITSVVCHFIPKEAHLGQILIPPAAVALGFGFSAGVGMIFGMFPAIKASRLDPIEALRHE